MRQRAWTTLWVMLASLLGFEGVLSLTGQPSLLRLLAGRLQLAPGWSLAAPHSALPEGAGPGWLHPDPRVGFALRPHSTGETAGVPYTTDELGLRARPGGAVIAGTVRIAVVGASIPFGYGVGDSETLAHQLELQLNAVRGPDLPAVTCRTVAMGRWSHRNAVSFLLDHWDGLRPQLVVLLPFANDMSDTDVVQSDGYRASWPDVASRDPWLRVDTDATRSLLHRVQQLAALGPPELRWDHFGADALTADISPQSSQRFDDNAHSVELLASVLQARGGQLLFAQYREDDHNWHLLRRLDERGLSLPVVPMFAGSGVPKGFTLADDPHPNASTHGVMATWVAQALLESGWVAAGAGRPLPDVPRAYLDARAAPSTAAQRAARAAAARQVSLRCLLDRVDFLDGRGTAQLYGGVDSDGLAGTGVRLMLARAGGQVRVLLQALPGRPDLQPLRVQVELDGVVVGSLDMPPEGTVEGVFVVPPGGDPTTALEVALRPSQWVVVAPRNLPRAASFRPLLVICEPSDAPQR